eukprot:gene14739-biopygen1942
MGGKWTTRNVLQIFPTNPCGISGDRKGTLRTVVLLGGGAARRGAGGVTDFGAHQLVATTDQSVFAKRLPAFVDHWLSLTLFGYLNDHVLHPALADRVESVVEQ